MQTSPAGPSLARSWGIPPEVRLRGREFNFGQTEEKCERERGGGEVPGGISAAAVSRSILAFRQSERVVQETSQLFRAVRAESCFNGGAAAVGPYSRARSLT